MWRVALLLAALGFLLAALWPSSTIEPPTTVSRVNQNAAAPDPGAEPSVRASPSREAEPEPERVAASNPALSALRVRTCERGSGQPVAGSRVATARGDGRSALAYWHAGSTDANGELLLTDLAPGWLSVRASNGKDEAWTQLHRGATDEVVLAIEPLSELTGRVVNRDGNPVATAELWISDVDAEQEGEVVARTQADGTFKFGIRGLDRVLVARASGVGVSDAFALNAPRAFDEELVIRLEHGAGCVVGTVTGTDGHPVAGARIVVGAFSPWTRDTIGSGPYGQAGRASAVVPTTTNDDGTFQAEAVPCVISTSIFVRSAGWVPQSQALDVRQGETTRIDIRLERGFHVRGVVTTSDGRPAAGVTVDAKPPRQRGMDQPPEWMSCKTMSLADGTFVLCDLAAGTRELGAESALGRANQKLEGAAGASLTWNPVLDAGRTITGKLVDDAGNPLAGWSMRMEGERQRMWRETGSGGEFVFARCTEASFKLSVHQKGAWMPTDVLTLRDVVADRAPLELRVPRGALSTSSVSGTVLDCRGLPATSVISVRVDNTEMSQEMSMAFPAGRFVVAPIRAGAFRIVIMVAGHETLSLPQFDLAAGEARDLGALKLVRAASK
jgi:hypothetical protein